METIKTLEPGHPHHETIRGVIIVVGKLLISNYTQFGYEILRNDQ